jgi:hypothetical protein
MITFDSIQTALAQQGYHPGVLLGGHYPTRDGKKTVDSAGAFLHGELERLDMTLNLPMVDIEYTRDVDLRTDVTIADDYSSITNSAVASNGGLGTGQGIGNGKAWVGKDATQIAGVGLDISKTPNPLHPWAIEVKYNAFELASAAKVGRPVDEQKIEAMEFKRQMDIDEMAYIGDLTLNVGGLYNSARVTAVTNLPVGAAGFSQWINKTPDEILLDFNTMLTTAWANTGYKVKPNRILLPPVQFGYIATAKVATASGLISIKRYIEENNLITAGSTGKADGEQRLIIESSKWGIGSGAGGTIGTLGTVDRAVVYTKNYKYLRMPITQSGTPIRTPIQYDGLYMKFYYYMKMGGLELPYPNTISYWDGL